MTDGFWTRYVDRRDRFWLGVALKAFVVGLVAFLIGIPLSNRSSTAQIVIYVVVACCVAVGWFVVIRGFVVRLKRLWNRI